MINISKHSGKMEGIPSISTNKLTNANCIKMSHIKNSICSHCYVEDTIKRYTFKDGTCRLTNNLEENTQLLTKRLLTNEEIKHIEGLVNRLYVRFEAFGDLNNETQLINYVNIAKHFKNTHFTLWTKQFFLIFNYLKSGKKLSKNMTLVLSSPLLNEEINKSLVDIVKKYHKDTITFTVVDDKTREDINCGGKKCINCLNCYKSGKKKNVIELLK